MDEEIERLLVSVRADTTGFARDVADMRGQLEGPLEAGAARAGRALETALTRAVWTGKVGFEDLKRIALSAMADIAAASIRNAIGDLGGGGGGGAKAGIGGGLRLGAAASAARWIYMVRRRGGGGGGFRRCAFPHRPWARGERRTGLFDGGGDDCVGRGAEE